MSLTSRQRLKAAQVKLDDDGITPPSTPALPKTAPGQLMGLQGRVLSQQSEIERLKSALRKRTSAKLPLSKLHEVPGRRRKLTSEEYSELRSNLEKYPLSTPISVIQRADGDFDIVAGNNRVAIYGEMGREDIDAVLLDIDDSMVEYIAFFSNLFSPSLTDFEKYWGFKALQERTGIGRDELAKSSGISETHVTRIMKFDALPEEAKMLLADRPERLGAKAAERLVAVGKDKPEKIIEAVHRLVEDEKFTQTQAVALVEKKQESSDTRPSYEVKMGKRKVCNITTHKDVIGIRMCGTKPLDVDEWARKIQEFIAKELSISN